ncbi:MAG: copper amine oxidase domain protein [Herbinix sp.]|jgi:hypothetical protein|nr:copper amine oxidase domain protein [Herbinix sp.]
MKKMIRSFLLAVCLILVLPISTIQADETERTDDFNAFAETFTKAEGDTIYNNYYDSLASSSGIIQPLSIKLNSDTRITWLATYHEYVFSEEDREDMVIVLSQIDPTIKGANKTIFSYSFKTTSYGISATGNIMPDNHYFVAIPNMIFPKGEYVVSVRSSSSYFPSLTMDMAILVEDLDEYMSHYSWMGNINNANPSGTRGSLSIKGIPGTLSDKQLPVETTRTMNMNTLQAEIKKIKDDAFAAYIQSDEYKEAWALVEEELLRAEAYRKCLAEQQKIKDAKKPITMVVNGFSVPTIVAPVFKDGRVLVPVRALSEALDCSVAYDSTTKTIRIADNITGILLMEMVIGRRTAKVLTPSGWYDDRIMDVPPQIINSSTMVPVRFVSEAMDFLVEWSGSTKTVVITSGGQG